MFNFKNLEFCLLLCYIGLLVTLWAIDRLGRRKTMAFCFFIFSHSTLWLCWEVRCIQVRMLNIKLGIHHLSNINDFSLLQSIHDSVDIHRQSFHRRRIPGCLRVHSRGEISHQSAGVSL